MSISLAHVAARTDPSERATDDPMKSEKAAAGGSSPITVTPRGARGAHHDGAPVPRLLTERQAARYLGLPIAAMRRLLQGRVALDGRVRWDRKALDVWLDRESGIAPPADAMGHVADAEAALADWLADPAHASRHS